MSITKDNHGIIRLHDTTDHGGKVISVKHTEVIDMGCPVICVGDMANCPKCKGTYPIVEGDAECTVKGDRVAFDGHKTTACLLQLPP